MVIKMVLMSVNSSGIPTSFFPGLPAYSQLMSAQGSTALPGGGSGSSGGTTTTSKPTSTSTTKTTATPTGGSGTAAHVSSF
jgi:hypothetical protein